MKTLLSTIFFLLILTAQTVFAQLPEVVNITVSGHMYQLTELIEHYNRWYKHEPEYWKYKQFNSIFPLTIYKEDYLANKAFLKTLPDHRDFATKHPHLRNGMYLINMGSLVLNILQVVHI